MYSKEHLTVEFCLENEIISLKQRPVLRMEFVADELTLYHVSSPVHMRSEILGHVPALFLYLLTRFFGPKGEQRDLACSKVTNTRLSCTTWPLYLQNRNCVTQLAFVLFFHRFSFRARLRLVDSFLHAS